MEGTYPLPEAQLDRFLFKVMVPFPSEEDLVAIIDRTTGADAPTAQQGRHAPPRSSRCSAWRAPCPIAPHVTAYAVSVLAATHPDNAARARRSCASTSATAARRAAPRPS